MNGHLDFEVVRRWVEASCAEQGVAVKVTEREAVARAAALLGEGRRPAPAAPAAPTVPSRLRDDA
jgi:hypothetical protein